MHDGSAGAEIVSRLFADPAEARRAVAALRASGVPDARISLVESGNPSGDFVSWQRRLAAHSASASELPVPGLPAFGVRSVPQDEISTGTHTDPASGADLVPEAAARGAGIGASAGTVAGGVAGLLAGTGWLAIPGFGPVVAGGWAIAAVTAAGIGAAIGGSAGVITGSLSSISGQTATRARLGAPRIQAAMVTVSTDGGQAEQVEAMLEAYHGQALVGAGSARA
ncbi:hypothetical protein [Rhizosaccharibacter radicis]|uniref:Uncharacterized protein n=1 Tax=Rhizosaccharibacter radicis TaxID=2782605 RepID=A0ABT1VYC8_9PROT|nr:hypothetical protein [Acetobacteraceae bacterium KSS12]